MNVISEACALGATTQSPAVLECARAYLAMVEKYLPRDLSTRLSTNDLQQARDNKRKMKGRTLTAEPVVEGLGRIFRDAMLDAQRGKTGATSPGPNKKANKPEM